MDEILSDSHDRAGIVLIGYRATGKTTVGRSLADRIGRPFLDADAELESRSGRTIRDLFARDGEPAFRDLEEWTIAELCKGSPGAVLATGGGAVLREANRRALKRFGVVVWLSAPPEVLVERLRRDEGERPALTSSGLLDEVAGVLAAREPLYGEIADLVVDAAAPGPESVASAIADALASLDGPRVPVR